jgi:hypothetical protein
MHLLKLTCRGSRRNHIHGDSLRLCESPEFRQQLPVDRTLISLQPIKSDPIETRHLRRRDVDEHRRSLSIPNSRLATIAPPGRIRMLLGFPLRFTMQAMNSRSNLYRALAARSVLPIRTLVSATRT